MPLISVDELMFDPDFVTESLRLYTTIEIVGVNGRNTITRSMQPIVGVVTPTSARDLVRLPEGSTSGGSITVTTAYPLTSGDPAQNKPADQISWKGDLYVVTRLDDYSEFGRGFISALCTLQPLS